MVSVHLIHINYFHESIHIENCIQRHVSILICVNGIRLDSQMLVKLLQSSYICMYLFTPSEKNGRVSYFREEEVLNLKDPDKNIFFISALVAWGNRVTKCTQY